MQKTGWEFWIWRDDHFEFLLVGFEDFAKAKKLALDQVKSGAITRHNQLDEAQMLKLALSERVMPASIIRPF